MLLQIDQRTKAITHLEGDAHVIVTICADGSLLLSGYRLGLWNTTYANHKESVLNQVPVLVAELREELAAIKAAD